MRFFAPSFSSVCLSFFRILLGFYVDFKSAAIFSFWVQLLVCFGGFSNASVERGWQDGLWPVGRSVVACCNRSWQPSATELILDSGSYVPVVYNASCLCGNFSTSRYFPGSSGTSVVSDISSTTSYGAGELLGDWAEDSLWMSSPGWGPELELLAVNFTLATSSKWLPSEDMNRWGGSGILGMGPLSGVPSAGPVPHTAASLIAAGIDMFATWLPRGLVLESHGLFFGLWRRFQSPCDYDF